MILIANFVKCETKMPYWRRKEHSFAATNHHSNRDFLTMILLDTGLLIAMVKPHDFHHGIAHQLASHFQNFSTASVAWMELLSRPMPPEEISALHALLTGGIIPFDEKTAAFAGELYYVTGSKRRTRLDTMIAATAILSGAELATTNPSDFQDFVPHGLKLHPF